MPSLPSSEFPVEKLWEHYELNPLTGQLWSKRYKHYLRGNKGHSSVRIELPTFKGERIQTSVGRVVYAFIHGYWPVPTVDHIDQDFTNNRPWNLREANMAIQCKNRSSYRGGIHYKKPKGTRRGRWVAALTIDGKQKTLGSFQSEAEARACYQSELLKRESH